MPQTFSSLGTRLHNVTIRAFQPLFGLLTKLANAPEVKEFVNGIINNIKFIAPIITGAVNVIIFSIRKVMAFFQQHQGIFAMLKAGFAVVAIGAGLLAAEYAAMGIAAAFAAIKTAILNSALLASPITWIVLGIVALIVVIYQLINMYEEWADTSVSVIGAIAALFTQFGIHIANIFVGLWNYIAAFANFLANVWKDPLGAVQNLFIDIWNAIAGYVAKAVNNIIDSINKIPGINTLKYKPNINNIEVDKEILVGRAVGRRICKSCGATYHVEFNPSKENGVCDVCQGELYQRADDNEETVSKRIQVYLDETKPLVDYYSSQGIIANINGQQSIEKVFEDIVNALGCEK